MHFLTFHNLDGGFESFFASDVKRVSQLRLSTPGGGIQWVTQVWFGDRDMKTLSEPYEEIMARLMEAWGGEQSA